MSSNLTSACPSTPSLSPAGEGSDGGERVGLPKMKCCHPGDPSDQDGVAFSRLPHSTHRFRPGICFKSNRVNTHRSRYDQHKRTFLSSSKRFPNLIFHSSNGRAECFRPLGRFVGAWLFSSLRDGFTTFVNAGSFSAAILNVTTKRFRNQVYISCMAGVRSAKLWVANGCVPYCEKIFRFEARAQTTGAPSRLFRGLFDPSGPK